MKGLLAIGSVLLLSLAVSCVPIPMKVGTRGAITKGALEFLEEGVTTREQVLLHLGEPDFADEHEQIFVWEWVYALDVYAGGASPQGGGAFGVLSFRTCNGLVIEFNDQGVAQGVEKWKEEMARDHACKLGGPLSRSNEYTNHVYGFSIQFPPEWGVTRGSQSLGELDVSELPKEWGVKNGAEIINAANVAGLSIAIAAYPIARKLEVWEVRPERIGNILSPMALKAIRIVDLVIVDLVGSGTTTVSPVSSETTTVSLVGSGRTRAVDGSHAIWMKQEIEKQDSGLAGVFLTYSLVHHRKLFQISGYWPKNNDESQAQKFEQKIEKAIWSFRFIR